MSASSASPRRAPGAPDVRPRPALGIPTRGPAAASPAPLIVAIAAFGVSLIVAIVVAVTPASAPVSLLGVVVPLATRDAWWLSLVGYLLTPIAVIACYGWNAVGQRNRLRADRNFVLRPSWSTALLWLAGASIVLGAWHVLSLAVPLSELWGPP